MGKYSHLLNYKDIEHLYCSEKLTSRQIATKLGIPSHKIIINFMNYHCIRRRKNYYPANIGVPRFNLDSLSKEEIGYLAGILDGEGCIHVKENIKDQFISFGNTSKELIEWLAGLFKVNYYTALPNMITHRKAVYSISVYRAADIISILETTIPHLKIKPDQAKQALQIIKNKYKL